MQKEELQRKKRDAHEKPEGAQNAPTAGAGAHRASGLDKEYDERKPRCMDLVLDCAKQVGQVQVIE